METDAEPPTTRIYLASAFDDGTGPADLAPSRRYGRDVSIDAPVVQLAPGVSLDGEAMFHAARGASLLDAMRNAVLATSPQGDPLAADAARALLVDTGVPALRAFVTTASGVHVSFPGIGGFPPDYDGRDRDKYTSALAQSARAASVTWGKLTGDRYNLGLVLPIAGVLVDQGEVNGVAGLELSVAWIAEHVLAADVPGAEESLLLDEKGRVIVQLVHGQPPRYATPDGPGETESLRFETFTHAAALEAIAGPEAGVVELPNGRLVALYPLSAIPYTFALVADPRRLRTD
jgi:hypothetical protein